MVAFIAPSAFAMPFREDPRFMFPQGDRKSTMLEADGCGGKLDSRLLNDSEESKITRSC